MRRTNLVLNRIIAGAILTWAIACSSGAQSAHEDAAANRDLALTAAASDATGVDWENMEVDPDLADPGSGEASRTRSPTRGTPTVDCKTFPDSITCHECNSTGPGTFDCCNLAKRGDDCIIVNDPNAVVRVPRDRGAVLKAN